MHSSNTIAKKRIEDAKWNSLDITNDDVRSVDAFKRLVKRSNLSDFMYF